MLLYKQCIQPRTTRQVFKPNIQAHIPLCSVGPAWFTSNAIPISLGINQQFPYLRATCSFFRLFHSFCFVLFSGTYCLGLLCFLKEKLQEYFYIYLILSSILIFTPTILKECSRNSPKTFLSQIFFFRSSISYFSSFGFCDIALSCSHSTPPWPLLLSPLVSVCLLYTFVLVPLSVLSALIYLTQSYRDMLALGHRCEHRQCSNSSNAKFLKQNLTSL